MKASGGRRPVRNALIVIGPLSDPARSRLATQMGARIAPLRGAPADINVVTVKPGHPQSLHEKVRRIAGNKVVVAPVLVEDGERLFPTGQIHVRFKSPPSDGQLTQFARRFRLRNATRNKWSPYQASFSVRSGETRFLPEIAASITIDEGVADAWLDTRAGFRRG